MQRLKQILKGPFRWLGLDIVRRGGAHLGNPFFSHYYQRNTRRRLEHLASLNLEIAGASVLEVGAGTGDHTDFFVDRGCRVVTGDARQDNCNILRSRYPDLRVLQLDLDHPPQDLGETFDIVYCYGLLYHLNDPAQALRFLSDCCSNMLLLSTCVAYGDASAVYPAREDATQVLQSISGKGCRPTRRWVFEKLKETFEHVTMPITQPNHVEFPIDWSVSNSEPLPKTVYIASRTKIENELLTAEIPTKQRRH